MPPLPLVSVKKEQSEDPTVWLEIAMHAAMPDRPPPSSLLPPSAALAACVLVLAILLVDFVRPEWLALN